MGTHTVGFDALIKDLESMPERAPKAFRQVMVHGGMNIKKDWTARWKGMPHEHIPHLVRLIAFDLTQEGNKFVLEVGVTPNRKQSRLASFLEYGTLTSGAHPGGEPALEAELPNLLHWLEKVTEDLLEGQS